MSVGWGQDCVDGVEVELWGECYNIETTTSLNLSGSGLSGEIPSEIGQQLYYLYEQFIGDTLYLVGGLSEETWSYVSVIID